MDDPRGFVDFQTVLWDVDDRTCTILWVLLFYFMTGLWIWKKNGQNRHIRISLAYVIMIILIWIPMARRKSLAFLDVGQGDCFVADTKSGAIIFDGGSSSEDQVEDIGFFRI